MAIGDWLGFLGVLWLGVVVLLWLGVSGTGGGVGVCAGVGVAAGVWAKRTPAATTTSATLHIPIVGETVFRANVLLFLSRVRGTTEIR